jgi:hypothetical protein
MPIGLRPKTVGFFNPTFNTHLPLTIEPQINDNDDDARQRRRKDEERRRTMNDEELAQCIMIVHHR